MAGDWFDVVENADGIWVTIADGLGETTRATAPGAVALGALRASRRSGGGIGEALVVMHQALRELPGPRAEMTVVIAHWDPVTRRLDVANCGHVHPLVCRDDGATFPMEFPRRPGLGGRASPKPAERVDALHPGDRLVMVSDGVVKRGDGMAGLGFDGLVEAALSSGRATAADTVRRIHAAVLAASGGELEDDATAVCLSVE